MYSRTVKVGDVSVDVSCTPDTPLWEVLERAAAILKRQHQERERQSENKAIAQMLKSAGP
jgi:hypothetical protein